MPQTHEEFGAFMQNPLLLQWLSSMGECTLLQIIWLASAAGSIGPTAPTVDVADVVFAVAPEAAAGAARPDERGTLVPAPAKRGRIAGNTTEE